MNAIAQPDLDAVASLRGRLADGGWRPLAVYNCDATDRSPGKRPKGDDWELRARRDPPEAATARPERDALNTGLLCDGLRAVDVDIDDRDLAATIRAQAVASFGKTLVRTRSNTGRCLLVYRATEGSPAKRVLSGTRGKVEVLGHGQQFVAYGLHPSGASLQWPLGGPDTTAADAVPTVSEPAVIAFLASVAPAIGADAKARLAGADALHVPSILGPRAASLDVTGALHCIPNDRPADWEHWNRIGLATYAATGGSTSGFAAWCAWSEQHPLHNAAACSERWQHFPTSPPGSIGAGTLFRMAKEARPGWQKPSEAAAATKQEAGPQSPAADPELLAHPDLTVLRLNRRLPPVLPLAVFGDGWARWIAAVAEGAACPPDYVAGPLLAAASALIGNSRWAQATPSWAEPPHVWCASIGDSGTGKSPGGDVLMRHVLPDIERRMIGDFPDRLRDYKAQKEGHEAAMERWKADVRTAQKSGHSPPLPPAGELPAEPQAPRLRQSDVTIEKVATLLAQAAPKGLLLTRDELAGWLLGMNTYNDGARAFWIEAYGGRPYRVERQKHPEPIEVPHMTVAVTGGTQPERLAELLRDADDGLLARFCWFWPDPQPFRLARTTQGADWATAALDRLRLLDLQPGAVGEPARPIMVPLAEAALQQLEAFARDMQDRQQHAAGLMRSALGKARGLALRLSLVLDMLQWCARDGYGPPPSIISEAAFAAAATLVADYIVPMAERTYGDAACPEADRNAATFARWIMRDRPKEAHVRTLQREVRLPGLTEADKIKAAALVLVEAGWLLPPSIGFGAASKVAYPVNPRVFKVAT